MTEKIKERVIPKEDAVFRLDKNGRWYNQYGAFEHKKIITFFHSAIQRDSQGYFLEQEHGEYKEKVYFPYEDTALFVFDVILENDITLVLNTGEHIKLSPDQLFMKGDNLYMHYCGERVKFVERGLMKISKSIEEEKDLYFIRVKNKKYRIKDDKGSVQ